MNKYIKMLWAVIVSCVFVGMAYADTTPIQDIGYLVGNWSTLPIIAVVSVIVQLLIKILNMDFVGNWFDTITGRKKLLVIGILSILLAGIGVYVSGDHNWRDILAAMVAAPSAQVYIHQYFPSQRDAVTPAGQPPIG